jgi:hypothetical protein
MGGWGHALWRETMHWRGRVVMNLAMKLLVILTFQEKIEKAREDMYACMNSETPLKKVHFVFKIVKLLIIRKQKSFTQLFRVSNSF